MNAYGEQILSLIISSDDLAAQPSIPDFGYGYSWSASHVVYLASAKPRVRDVKYRAGVPLKHIFCFLGRALYVSDELVAGFWHAFPPFAQSWKSC